MHHCILNTLGRFFFWSTFLCSGIPASAIAISLERKSRRGMLALYLSNLAVETIYNMLKSRGKIKALYNGEVLLFSIAMALYMYLFKMKDGLDKNSESALKFIFGSSELHPESKLQDSNTNNARPQGPKGRLPPAMQQILDVMMCKNGVKHECCQHKHGCIHYTLKGFFRNFVLGYGIQATIKFVSALFSVFKQPKRLYKAFFNINNLNLGLFLGLFSSLFRAVCCLMRWLRNKDDSKHGLIAGFISAWSMVYYKSSSIALYVASKFAEVLWFKGVDSGKLPKWKYGDSVLYALATGLVLHVAVFEPHNLRPAYWTFLLKLTRNRFEPIELRRVPIVLEDFDFLLLDTVLRKEPALLGMDEATSNARDSIGRISTYSFYALKKYYELSNQWEAVSYWLDQELPALLQAMSPEEDCFRVLSVGPVAEFVDTTILRNIRQWLSTREPRNTYKNQRSMYCKFIEPMEDVAEVRKKYEKALRNKRGIALTMDWTTLTPDEFKADFEDGMDEATQYHMVHMMQALYFAKDLEETILFHYESVKPGGILLICVNSDDNTRAKLLVKFMSGRFSRNASEVESTLTKQNWKFSRHELPLVTDVSEIYDEKSEVGKVLLDYLSSAIKFRERAPAHLLDAALFHFKAPENCYNRKGEILAKMGITLFIVNKTIDASKPSESETDEAKNDSQS
ncbi:uncharacterized protein [Ptychodera flava]|uniref:uncharacterized protein isoform X2 n=1 Tax=Ptychodera flava TaxID=63121 RepID=UPI00396A9138